jgi:hypothetical protein
MAHGAAAPDARFEAEAAERLDQTVHETVSDMRRSVMGPLAFAVALGLVVLGFAVMASPALHAQTAGKAPCGSFRKLPDGKWVVTKQLKIQNGGATGVLNAGMVINPGFRSAGADIYAALQKSCQSP